MVRGVAVWDVKMLARNRSKVDWLVERGRTGPASDGWRRASVRTFGTVINRYVEDGAGMDALVGNHERVSELRYPRVSGIHEFDLCTGGASGFQSKFNAPHSCA